MPIYTKKDEDELDEIVVGKDTTEKNKGKPAHEAEDLGWKDRYGNLRSYTQKELNKKDQEIADLKREVEKKNVNLPKTKEEVEAWAKKYPEPYAFVKSIIGLDLGEVTSDVSSRFKEIQERELQADKRDAELKLAEIHPDFFTKIRDSEEFSEWLAGKSKRTQDALYEDDDPIAAAEVISLYKAETGFGKPPKKASNKNDAAFEVPNRSKPSPNNGSKDYDFTESQIESMSSREFDANEEAITEAQREGRIYYDLTGGAR